MARTVAEIMNRELFKVREHDGVTDVLHYFVALGITGAPVVDVHDRVIGFVSWRDLLSGEEEGTISLGGNVQGPVTEPGAVIAVLVPEQAPILRALKDDQIVLFPLQATATLSPGREYFTSQQQRQPVAFPRYQVYLYNTGARTVEASLWAYLGN